MTDVDWVLLRKFDNLMEARVLESLLTARGFEVQLLGAHSFPLLPIKGPGTGLRLLVKAEDLERARSVIEDAQRTAHLEVVDSEHAAPTPVSDHFERNLILFIITMLVLIYVASHLR